MIDHIIPTARGPLFGAATSPDAQTKVWREPKTAHVMQVENGFVVSVSDIGGTTQYIARSGRQIASIVRAHFEEEKTQ